MHAILSEPNGDHIQTQWFAVASLVTQFRGLGGLDIITSEI
jgi:hypothetical protein